MSSSAPQRLPFPASPRFLAQLAPRCFPTLPRPPFSSSLSGEKASRVPKFHRFIVSEQGNERRGFVEEAEYHKLAQLAEPTRPETNGQCRRITGHIAPSTRRSFGQTDVGTAFRETLSRPAL